MKTSEFQAFIVKSRLVEKSNQMNFMQNLKRFKGVLGLGWGGFKNPEEVSTSGQ